ncbi:Hypothetical Protein FCC1311_038192 [Hondaea fermentalgiana]|uniref:Sulfotransferase n=1 Tax=Hondaea fermentalgiana TaxID=2315210 RepID=A0A2R5G953_9STRA|nr:Hypothetical Protein FCC1311_038192 [Hondaea fermentalgiana]|eukprot:GBG27596.1 Hypothetical Protein FCC1311_038192 [Hondaea fermentalgiana]
MEKPRNEDWSPRRWQWTRRAPRLRVALAIVWLLELLVRVITFGKRPAQWTVNAVERRGKELHFKSRCQQGQAHGSGTASPSGEIKNVNETEPALFHRVGLKHFLREVPQTDFAFIGKFLPLAKIMQKKLCIETLRARSPAVRNFELPPVIWIVSLPRTGSTWLHQLCASEPSIRTVKAWELKYPMECSEDCGPSKLERQEFTKRAMEKLYDIVPRFKQIHHVRFDDPDECVGGFVDGWSPEHWLWGMLDMPETRAAYLKESMHAQYENYKHLLQAVMAADEDGEVPVQVQGGSKKSPFARLVLKSPHHIVKLKDLATVFPGSAVLWLDRDVTDVVGSCCSMNQAVLDTLCPWYDDLKSDPAMTLAEAMQSIGFTMSEEALANIRCQQAERRASAEVRRDDKKQAHKYTLADFGLSRADVELSFRNACSATEIYHTRQNLPS